MDLMAYLAFAADLAYRAGRLTLGYFDAGIRSDFKPDDTPVTAADQAAESFMRSEIEKSFPGHAILGEEYGGSDTATGREQGEPEAAEAPSNRGADRCRWLIDPIDGTKSFMRGVPLYGVLLALEVDGVVRVGAAYYPGTDELLSAADGLGCWWNGRRARVSDRGLDRGLVCFTTYRNFEKYDRLAAWQRLQDGAYMVRGWSDAYGYLLVATGRAEAMLDPVMAVWDCGPFPVILREAGGFFGSWDGREGHTHGEGMACNAIVKGQMVDILRT
jgi:myo-inositol-1(or 4)-monophosphatase